MHVPADKSNRRIQLTRGFTARSNLDMSHMDTLKYINDPIHGYISLDDYALRFIDTPQFQRLRHLKQLGTSFEHCIGTSFLANNVVTGLKERQPELDINERDIRCVTLAGLCHDLGHGPFSHVFDNEFIPRARPGLSWSHEEGSKMMLQYAIDDNHIDIDTDDVKFIKQLILGTKATSIGTEKMFLFDIVANKRNGVDVDKFDYIQRDCYNVGVKSSYDFSRLMLNSREAYNLTEMFHTRYSLHKRVYAHPAAKAIEFMLIDAMLIADPVLELSQAVLDPERYLYLTDEIVRDIERSREPELETARAILRRLQKRELYKLVDEFILPPELSSIADSRIVKFRSDNDDFTERDVLVDINRMHYGMKNENPVEHINFYSKYNGDEKFPIASELISACVPNKYEELIIRIFTRDPAKSKQIQRAARRLMVTFNSSPFIASSPLKSITPNRGLTFPDSMDEPDIKKRRLDFSAKPDCAEEQALSKL
ncbi:HD-domain/PDEase-like protein [Linderina pennispora]|uniref:HD-domain/PDEase-like protein n=1 Tax=Linderina pennispora TaxID=61395 RepID=A0A1Y1WET5_9FUNG|nr:HD-domain/PDEase-like protein [Linderina pennispora]ORX72003.1 HD-domain/PDEase-like protein [Linderina pennispora]